MELWLLARVNSLQWCEFFSLHVVVNTSKSQKSHSLIQGCITEQTASAEMRGKLLPAV